MKYLRSLTKPPNSFGDTNKWADYLEVLCLTSMDNIISADDIYDKLYGDKSDDESSTSTNEYETEDGESDIVEYMVETSSEKSDVRQSKINDVFEFLVSRNSLFEDSYPFRVSLGPRYIKLNDNISFKQYSYLGLLISSNLDYFSYFKSDLTTNFELNSIFVFKKLFPENAKIEYFGKGAARSKIFSANKLIDRIKQLSEILQFPLASVFDEAEIGQNNTGDGGLDLVGWYDIADNNSGKIINFGQCACGKDWFNKQFDISMSKWKNYLHPRHPILTTLITPSSFRKYDGSWFNNMKIYDCIIIDRSRFLKSLRKRENSKVATVNMEMVKILKEINLSHFN